MAVKGKGEQVAADDSKFKKMQVAAEPTSVTRASAKRRRGPGDEAEGPSSSVAAKRRRGAGAVPEEEEGHNQEHKPEDGHGDGCVLGETSTIQDRRFLPDVIRVMPWLVRAVQDLEHHERLIRIAPFACQVREITNACSSEVSRWTPEALLGLKDEAEFYLLDVFMCVVKLAKDARVLGSEDYNQKRPQRPHESKEGTLSMELSAAVKRTASMHIPFLAFLRQVHEITDRCLSGYRWSWRALLYLHEAGVKHLISLYESVNHFASLCIPYISDGTILTCEEEEAAFSLFCACASGIRTYVMTAKGTERARNLMFPKKFSEQCLSPRLGSDTWKAKVFASNNLTPVEVNFYTVKRKWNATLGAGWAKFVKTSGIKDGDVLAFTFEEEKEEDGAPLSVRVHILRTVTNPSPCDIASLEEKAQRTKRVLKPNIRVIGSEWAV